MTYRSLTALIVVIAAMAMAVAFPAPPTAAAQGETYVDLSCLLYTSPSPRDGLLSRMPSSA